MHVITGMIYSLILVIWVLLGLFAFRFGIKEMARWPHPDRRIFGARLIGVGYLAHSFSIGSMFFITLTSICQIIWIWKVVLTL